MKIKFILTTLLFFVQIVGLLAQDKKYGIPFTRNYLPKEYNGSPSNWTIIQDKRGVMYFGNASDVIEYDGKHWTFIELPNNSTVRSLTTDSAGTIYVGAVSEFGYLEPDSAGRLNYVSLSTLLDSINRNFKDVWKTYAVDSVIYFQTFTSLIRYIPNTKNPFKIWKPQTSFAFSFLYQGNIYIKEPLGPLTILNTANDELEEVKGGEHFAGIPIYMTAMLPFSQSDSILIGTYARGLYAYNPLNTQTGTGGTIIKFQSEAETFFRQNFIYHGAILNTENFAFSTLGNGVFILNKAGQIKEHLNKKSGLQDNMGTYVYNNSEIPGSPLWITLNSGISRTEINSPFRHWPQTMGLEGTIHDVVHFNNRIYVASSLGIFYLNDDNYFKHIDDVKTQAWCFYKYKKDKDEYLFLGTNSGVYEVKNFSVEKALKDNYYTYKMYAPTPESDTIYLGLRDGFAQMVKDGKMWKNLGRVEQVKDDIRCIYKDKKNNELWLGTAYNGVIKLTHEKDTILVKYYNTKFGLPANNSIKIKKFQHSFIFITEKGIYKYNEKNDKFVPDTTLGADFATTGVLRFEEDETGNCWLNNWNVGSQWSEVIYKQPDGSYIRDSIPFKRLPPMNVYNIKPLNNGITWFCSSEGLFSYNMHVKKKYNQNFNVLIRKVSLGEDSVIFWGTNYLTNDIQIDSLTTKTQRVITLDQPLAMRKILKYDENSLTFEYSSLFFEEEESTKYSYFLEGFDEKWSKWSDKNYKEYTNLSKGEYVFRVKAKNIYDAESHEALYRFEIKPPWYDTVIFYVTQAALFILLLIISAILNRKGKAQKLTKALTYIVVIVIFKIFNMGIAPYLTMISGGVPIFKIGMSILLGLAITPVEKFISQFIKGEKKDEEKNEEKENDKKETNEKNEKTDEDKQNINDDNNLNEIDE